MFHIHLVNSASTCFCCACHLCSFKVFNYKSSIIIVFFANDNNNYIMLSCFTSNCKRVILQNYLHTSRAQTWKVRIYAHPQSHYYVSRISCWTMLSTFILCGSSSVMQILYHISSRLGRRNIPSVYTSHSHLSCFLQVTSIFNNQFPQNYECDWRWRYIFHYAPLKLLNEDAAMNFDMAPTISTRIRARLVD